VRSLVQQIQVGEGQIVVWLNRTAIVSSVMPNAPPKPTDSVESFVLSITASLRRAGKGVRLVIGNGAVKAIDSGLASLIARAIATRNMLLAGRDDSIDAMASRAPNARHGSRQDWPEYCLFILPWVSSQACDSCPWSGRITHPAASQGLFCISLSSHRSRCPRRRKTQQSAKLAGEIAKAECHAGHSREASTAFSEACTAFLRIMSRIGANAFEHFRRAALRSAPSSSRARYEFADLAHTLHFRSPDSGAAAMALAGALR
jgi:hypothetical protein